MSMRGRSRQDLARRTARVRASTLLIVQATTAATFAFILARDVAGHAMPFFAPIAAVATVATSLGSRLRRSFELVLGNAVGILLADGLIAVIGTGTWQLSLVVALALVVALFLGGGPVIIMQSASAAILISTTMPPTADSPLNTGRFVDALIGGGIGLAVSALLIPLNPLRLARRGVAPVLDALAGGYRDVADALEAGDLAGANEALAKVRATGPILDAMHMQLSAGGEVVTLAPARWGHRSQLADYLQAAGHLGNALRNLRVLARQVAIALDKKEPLPLCLAQALRELAAAADALGPGLARETSMEAPRRLALLAVASAASSLAHTSGFFGAPMVAQVRLSSSDLLQAAGLDTQEAALLIRDKAESKEEPLA